MSRIPFFLLIAGTATGVLVLGGCVTLENGFEPAESADPANPFGDDVVQSLQDIASQLPKPEARKPSADSRDATNRAKLNEMRERLKQRPRRPQARPIAKPPQPATPPVAEAPKGPLKGDLNQDGAVTKADADIALDISVRKVNPTAYQREAGDMNGDGLIDSADATLMMRAAEKS